MPDNICARDLMRTKFSRIRTDDTLVDAMVALREAQAEAGLPNALMVVDPDGKFVGTMTAKLLIRTLLGAEPSNESFDELQLLGEVRGRLANQVIDDLEQNVAVVGPDDRLLTMIRRGLPAHLDFIPVVDAGEPVGFVPLTAIFESAASQALTPEHEGIRFDR